MLHSLALCAGVVVAVTFQKVDGTPDTEASAEGDNESLQYSNCTIEKCHNEILQKI